MTPIYDTKKYKVLLDTQEIDNVDKIINVLSKIKNVEVVGINDNDEMLSILKSDHTFDVLIIDYDEYEIVNILKHVRMYNTSVFVLLLVDENDEEPSLELLNRYNIQGYCNKTRYGYDELKIWVHSAIRMLEQTKMLKQLYVQTKKQADVIKELNSKIEVNYYDTIDTLRKAVDKKDPYTRGHSDRVGYISALIAEELGMSEEEIETIKVGGFFHDIGKIGIKDAILTKPSYLTDDEYYEIKSHPIVGYELLEDNEIFKDILYIIRNHHERYDGTGYPDKLKGENIPIGARIVTIADAFDAMMSKRSYREKLDLETAISEIENNKGTQFDPIIAEKFVRLLREKYDLIEKMTGEY